MAEMPRRIAERWANKAVIFSTLSTMDVNQHSLGVGIGATDPLNI